MLGSSSSSSSIISTSSSSSTVCFLPRPFAAGAAFLPRAEAAALPLPLPLPPLAAVLRVGATESSASSSFWSSSLSLPERTSAAG